MSADKEETNLDQPLLSGNNEEEPIIAAPVAAEVDRTDNDAEEDHVPTGKWKDSLFNCFSYGLCHQSLLCACCCPIGEYLFISLLKKSRQ